MPTISISTKTTPLTVGVSLQVSQYPCKILNVEGYVGGASTSAQQYWIQAHSVAAPTSGVTVALWSRQVLGANGFSFTYSEENGPDTARLNYSVTAPAGDNTAAIYFVLSSTAEIYTAVTAGVTADLEVDIEQFSIDPVGATVQTATNVASLTVYADPAAADTARLLYFKAVNNSGADAYIFLYASSTDAAANGSTPLKVWKVANGASIEQFFGRVGIAVNSQDANGTAHSGCYLVASTTVPMLTQVVNGFNFTAWNL